MVATGGGEDDDNTLIFNINSNKSQFGISASTMASPSSTSASACSFPPVSYGRTMEEVWNDINLSSFHRHRHSTITTSNSNNSNTTTTTTTTTVASSGFIFQDFLARGAAGESLYQHRPCSSSNRSALLLNLNSGPDDQLNFSPPGRARMPSTPLLDVPFDQALLVSVDSSPTLLCNNGGLRMNVPTTEKSPGDRRHKRMIKNRESAARSRARKQAYTNELENEVERLKEENSRLRKQQQQLRNAAAAAAQLPNEKKTSLQRTSTAPF